MFEQSILPAPLTPPDCDLSGTHWMPLHGYRLFKSDFYLRATDQIKVVAQELWWASWVQVPAASIPDDDQVIASLAGFSRDPKGWIKIREKVLHGFVKCSDGRLYHSFLAGEAIKAYESRLKSDAKREADRARLQAWRDARRKSADNGDSAGNAVENGSETVPETPSETRFVGGRQNLTRQDKDKEERVGRAHAPALQKRGTRLPPDWHPEVGGDAICIERGLDFAETLANFRDYWTARPGKDGVKLDWDATWRNWCRNQRFPANQAKFRNGFAQLHAHRHALPETSQSNLPSFLRISDVK